MPQAAPERVEGPEHVVAETPFVAPTQTDAPAPPCESIPGRDIFWSPQSPAARHPLRIMAVSNEPIEAELRSAGAQTRGTSSRAGGRPFFWSLEVAEPPEGRLEVELRTAKSRTCRTISIAPPQASPGYMVSTTVARRRAWTPALENLYSAWIERMFDAPLSDQPSWPALHDVFADSRRNFLFNHLGMDEDGPKGLLLEPDCADLPYTLRAYFAIKWGLPFGFSTCSRGTGSRAPSCSDFRAREPRPSEDLASIKRFLRVDLANGVHSGSGRTSKEADATDFYPVPLSWDSLRPGTVYADPYGHLLVVVSRRPQTATSGGVLLAVDAQPDGTVSRRRFWRGNFLFALDPILGGAGFKHVRPLVRHKDTFRQLTNAEIRANSDYGDYSIEQYEFGVDGFYDRVDEVLSPRPMDPNQALLEILQALEEQVKGRVTSIENGRKYLLKSNAPVEMPESTQIFETTGPWEDFSTPSRDLRLLIAMDVALAFPSRVEKTPERFVHAPNETSESLKKRLTETLESELAQRKFSYVRTDATSFELTLSDIVNRREALEMTYNPNDCPEFRWGAPGGSNEARTCRHRAPAAQQKQMREIRSWFHDRRRPPRK